jgi:Tfp pilus assembly protein PilZ
MRVVYLRFDDIRRLLSFYQTMIPGDGFFLATRQELMEGEDLVLELEVPQLNGSYALGCTVLGSPRDKGLSTDSGYLLQFKEEAAPVRDELLEAIGWQLIGSNRRFHPRFPKAIAVAWREGSSEELHVDHTQNIGLGGAFVTTRDVPPEDSLLTMHFRCGGRNPALTLVGRVAWRRTNGDQAGMGIHFIGLDANKGLQLRRVLESD